MDVNSNVDREGLEIIGNRSDVELKSSRCPTEVRAQRTLTLDAAYAANPSRFRHRRPSPPKLPTVAWINEPSPEALIKSA